MTCPLHNWVIDLNTGKATYPDDGCTENYQIELRTEGLFLGFNLETKTAEIQAIQ